MATDAIVSNTAPDVPSLVSARLDTSTDTATIGRTAEQLEPAVRKKYGLLTPAEHDDLCNQEIENHSLVEGLIHPASVCVLIGDSGIGKSPLAYQLGICVASGRPFLGLPVRPGRAVVYADHENSPQDSRTMRDALARFIGLPSAPNSFIYWHESGPEFNLRGVCSELQPSLVIVDSLRAYSPSFEATEKAGTAMKDLRSIAHQYNVAILLIHHTKKPGPFGSPALENAILIQWLKEASGHSSIINQSDTRIAVADPGKGDGAMVMRWHRRIHGETGPLHLCRVLDEAGEPLGYRPMEGPELLANTNQQEAFSKLPPDFSFKEAVAAYERSDDPTAKWLAKCVSVGIVQKVSRGRYRKTWPKQADRVDRETPEAPPAQAVSALPPDNGVVA